MLYSLQKKKKPVISPTKKKRIMEALSARPKSSAVGTTLKTVGRIMSDKGKELLYNKKKKRFMVEPMSKKKKK